jgi:hypothetical protein
MDEAGFKWTELLIRCLFGGISLIFYVSGKEFKDKRL